MTPEAIQINDYARPLINIEFMQRVVHDACLLQDYVNARKVACELIAEAKILTHILAIMEEERVKLSK